VESAAGQVSPTGESVTELLARIARQAALIGEYRDREAAKDAVIESLQERAEEQDAQIEALAAQVGELRRRLGKDSLLTEQPRVFSQLGTLAGVLGCTVTAHDQRAGAGPFGARGAAGECGDERGRCRARVSVNETGNGMPHAHLDRSGNWTSWRC